MAASGLKYDHLKETKEKEMTDVSSSCNEDDYDSDDSDYEGPIHNNSSSNAIWWCQHPAVKRNKWTVTLAFLLLIVGIGCIIAGVVFEAIFHTGMNDIIRGFVFFAVGGLIILPSVYAILHIYLAAKRVGRVRFSSVWFFR